MYLCVRVLGCVYLVCSLVTMTASVLSLVHGNRLFAGKKTKTKTNPSDVSLGELQTY